MMKMKRRSSLSRRLTVQTSIFTRDVTPKAENDYKVFQMFKEAVYPYVGNIYGKTILDIGCGRLYPLSLLFKSQGNSVIGIDISYIRASEPFYLKYFMSLVRGGIMHFGQDVLYLILHKSRRYYQTLGHLSGFNLEHRSLDIRQMNALKMSFPDESFDMVISNAVLEHIVNVPQVITEIHRVLQREGIVCMRIDCFASPSGGHNPNWEKMPPWYHLRDKTWSPLDYLNRLRKDDFISLFSQKFKILRVLEERQGESLLTQEIRDELAAYSEEELLTQCITIIAQK